MSLYPPCFWNSIPTSMSVPSACPLGKCLFLCIIVSMILATLYGDQLATRDERKWEVSLSPSTPHTQYPLFFYDGNVIHSMLFEFEHCFKHTEVRVQCNNHLMTKYLLTESKEDICCWRLPVVKFCL